MKWVVAFHVIFMVAWFAGLFYLPRLFVYHAQAEDEIGQKRFLVMERKLYFYIMTPAAILTTVTGLWLLVLRYDHYAIAWWMHVKLFAVLLLWLYHFYCFHLFRQFTQGVNRYTHVFYRWYNEIPTLLLIVIIIMVVVKPF